MALEYASAKRGRVYKRNFDHDEALRLFTEEGWGVTRLAEYFGVSDTAVRRVVDPAERRRQAARSVAWGRANLRAPCKGGCGGLAWHTGRSGYCTTCSAKRQTAGDERDGELRCKKCGKWKPDEAFRVQPRYTRRGRTSWCRACETEARQRNRVANPERERAYERKRKRRKAAQMSDFVVLTESDAGFVEIGRVEAVSRLHAVEQIAKEPGSYVCLKADMLKPFTVEPVTRLSVVKNAE